MKIGDRVRLKRDIYRIQRDEINQCQEVLYAKEGDTGVVLDIFKTNIDGSRKGTLNVKVEMDGQIRTFRMTSLETLEK